MPLLTPNPRKTFQELRTMTPSLHKAKVSLSPQPLVFNDEVALVQSLTGWEKSQLQLSSAKIVQAAQNCLENRKNKPFGTDELIKARKTPLTTRSNLTSPVSHPSAKDLFDMQRDLWNINKQFELEIHSALDSQTALLKSLVDQRTEIRAELIRIRESLKKAQTELECDKKSLNKLQRSKKKSVSDLLRKNSLKQELFLKESKFAELELELKLLVDKNTKILENLDKQCTLVRREAQLLRETLEKHYKKSLKDGKDVRNEGIQWIVKAIWDLGLKVSNRDFPDFCDSEIIDFILKLAEKTRDFDELVKDRTTSKPRKIRHVVSSSQEKLNEVQLRLSKVSKQIRVKQAKVQVINHKKRVTWTELLPEAQIERQSPSRKPSLKPSDLLEEIASLKKSGLAYLLQTINHAKSQSKGNPILLISSFLGLEAAKKHFLNPSKPKRFPSDHFFIPNLFLKP